MGVMKGDTRSLDYGSYNNGKENGKHYIRVRYKLAF